MRLQLLPPHGTCPMWLLRIQSSVTGHYYNVNLRKLITNPIHMFRYFRWCLRSEMNMRNYLKGKEAV
jgi:hypothetical protein